MSYLNLMRNKLKPKEVNDALENITTPPASSVTYNNTSSGLTADDVQGAIDEVNAYIKENTLNGGESITVDTTDFIPITMSVDGYITIFTRVGGGTDTIDIALNTTGTNLVRLGTENGAYQFATLFLRKGTAIYIKVSTVNIGGYFITTLS